MDGLSARLLVGLPISGVIASTSIKLLQIPREIGSTKLATQDGVGLVIDVG